MERNQLKNWLIFLLILSAIVDLYTTLRHYTFFVMESNPVVGGGSAWMVFISLLLKFCAPVLIVYVLFETDHDAWRFFLASVCVVLIIMQFYAGWNNMQAKNNILQDIKNKNPGTYDNLTLDGVTQEMIKPYVPEQAVSRKNYMWVIFLFVYYPIIVANLSYFIHHLVGRHK